MKLRRHRIFAFASLLILGGCGHEQSKTTPPPPVVPAGKCTVQGVVNFAGAIPPVRVIGKPCAPGEPAPVDQSIVVNPNHTLKNVVVFIEHGPNVASASVPIPIDQKDCTYHPHVSAVRVGQKINVTSHDNVMHNVHVIPENAAQMNFTESHVGASHTISFSMPDIVHLKCDVHPWMSAWIDVFDHPFFAVTGKDGRFSIAYLPAGKYTLVARHEMFGELRQQITVTPGKPVEVTFKYSN